MHPINILAWNLGLHLPSLRDAPSTIRYVSTRTFQNAFKGDLASEIDFLTSTVLRED